MTEIATYELILKSDNKTCIEIIYNRYACKLLDYAITSWKIDEDDAWELIYDTIYKTIKTIDKYTFETEKKFSSFIFTVFCNALRNHFKLIKNQKDRYEQLNYNDLLLENISDNSMSVVDIKVKTSIS